MTWNPFRWWREFKERKRAEMRSKIVSDSKSVCTCLDCTCGKVDNSPAVTTIAQSDVNRYPYVPPVSRNRLKPIPGHTIHRKEYIYGDSAETEDDGIDPILMVVAADLLSSDNYDQPVQVEDVPSSVGGFTEPSAPATIEPVVFDSPSFSPVPDSPVFESNFSSDPSPSIDSD